MGRGPDGQSLRGVDQRFRIPRELRTSCRIVGNEEMAVLSAYRYFQ